MNDIIENTSQLTAGWLSKILRANVSRVSVETFKSFFADFYRLQIEYSGVSDLPRQMILKVPFADNESALKMGREEVTAYGALFESMMPPPAPPIPRCFAAGIDDGTGRSQILLEDLSPTHFCGNAKEEISVRQWERAVEALAVFHAFWWERDASDTPFGALLTQTTLDEIEKLCREGLPKFFATLSSEITPEIRTAYEKTLEFYPAFWRRRLLTREKNTLIHGDAHSWNFLFPKDATRDPAYFIDLATLRVRPATNDLAYLMALKWKRDLRARLEMPLLKHYHATLVSNGVLGYDWEDCMLDYRYSVITHLFTPVVQCAGGFLSPYIWQDNFRRITAAFEDLNCRELL